jgi:hypothetical protein
MHKVYQELLSLLELSDQHRTSLMHRGFTAEGIEQIGFKTMPFRRKVIVEQLLEKVSASELAMTAGFYRNNDKWALAGCAGIIIPIRNLDKTLAGLKIRSDRPTTPQSKYLMLSSNPKANKDGHINYPNGTAATICNHFPTWGAENAIADTLRITEGEFKAEIATEYTGVYTVSISGVSSWRMAIDAIKELKPKKVLLCFDADKDKANPYINKDGASDPTEEDLSKVGVALAKLYCAIRDNQLAHPVIEHWPMAAGKGIDDVITDGNEDIITQLTDTEAETFCNEMLMPNQPTGWVYTISTKRFHHVESMLEYDKEQYSDEYAHLVERGTAAKDAISNPQFKKFPSITYDPREPIVYVDKQTGHETYNLYRPSKVKPLAGDVTPLTDHFEYMFTNESECNIVYDYLAYNVQNKGQKILWMLIIRGHQGTGKSYIGDILLNMLGETNVSMPSNDEIHEIYTGWLKSSHLIIIEELMARGRLELMNKLKPIITQSIVQIREMHKPTYKMRNVANLIAFTNYDDSIILDKDDRRYCMIYSDVQPKSSMYYKKLWDWTRKNYSAILHWFLNRDLKNFNPQSHAPMTQGKKIAISATKMPIDEFIEDRFEHCDWPFKCDIISVTDLGEVIKKKFGKSVTNHWLGRKLKDLGAVQFPAQILLSTGSVKRLWALRDIKSWMKSYDEDKKRIATAYEDGLGNEDIEQTNQLLENEPY